MPNRILMNEVDASPGGGATPPSADPTASQGTQTQAAPAIAPDALKSAVTEALASVLPDLRNGIFADLRKAGAFKQDKQVEHPAPTPSEKQAAGATAPSGGLSLADVEAMLERERVVATRAAKFDLNDAQVKRMKSALHGVSQDLLATEADSFLNDLGLAKAPTQPVTNTATQTTTAAQAAQPISDKGSPAPGGVLDWEREFAENPIGMSAAARQRMDAKYGEDKARRMRVEAAQKQAQNVRVVRPQG